MTPKTTLLSLPTEILALLPHQLANIEDFKEASSTCRTLRAVFASTSPNTILRLAAASSRVFFRPDPYFLVAATISQVAEWALLSEGNTHILHRAIKTGIDGLFELCVEAAGLTMHDIRWLHASRFTTFNPAIGLIDRCAGKQWYDVPNFWNGGRSDAETIDCEPERALYELAIYGSLFRSTMEANLDGRLGFGLDVRLDFIKYCIPDWYCHSHRGFEVEMVGPYRHGWHDREKPIKPRMDQYSLRHVLKSSRWREEWGKVRRECGGDFEDEKRQRVWENTVIMRGLEGFEMLRVDGWEEKWKGRMLELRERVERVDLQGMRKGEVDVHGEIEWLGCPILEDEVFCCVRGMWPGYD